MGGNIYNNPMSGVDPSGFLGELSDTAMGNFYIGHPDNLNNLLAMQSMINFQNQAANNNVLGNYTGNAVVTTNNNTGPQNQSGAANVAVGNSGSSSGASGTRPVTTTSAPVVPSFNTGGGISLALPGVVPTSSQISRDAQGCASAVTCSLYDGLSSTEFSTGAELAGLSAGMRAANDLTTGSALSDGVRRAEELYGKLPDAYQKTAQSISATGQRLDVGSKFLGGAGYIFSAYQYGENMAKGDYAAARLNAADALMGAVAFLPGLGTATSVLYFSGRFAYDRLHED